MAPLHLPGGPGIDAYRIHENGRLRHLWGRLRWIQNLAGDANRRLPRAKGDHRLAMVEHPSVWPVHAVENKCEGGYRHGDDGAGADELLDCLDIVRGYPP